jgi:hypothetical protein
MILPSQMKGDAVEVIPKDAILQDQETGHKGAWFGIVANGGKKSVGRFIVEFIHNGSDFPTVQIWECAKGITPKVQTWNRTKIVKERVEVARKPKVKQETIKVDTEVKQEDLF